MKDSWFKLVRQIVITIVVGLAVGAIFSQAVFGATCEEFWADPTLPIDENLACLSWSIPTQNSDGSDLTDLEKYTIYYGTNAAPMAINATTIDITNPDADAYELVFDNVEEATYFFGITASDNDGNESVMSEIVSKLIRFVDTIGPQPPSQFRLQLRVRVPVDGGELVHP